MLVWLAYSMVNVSENRSRISIQGRLIVPLENESSDEMENESVGEMDIAWYDNERLEYVQQSATNSIVRLCHFLLFGIILRLNLELVFLGDFQF